MRRADNKRICTAFCTIWVGWQVGSGHAGGRAAFRPFRRRHEGPRQHATNIHQGARGSRGGRCAKVRKKRGHMHAKGRLVRGRRAARTVCRWPGGRPGCCPRVSDTRMRAAAASEPAPEERPPPALQTTAASDLPSNWYWRTKSRTYTSRKKTSICSGQHGQLDTL